MLKPIAALILAGLVLSGVAGCAPSAAGHNDVSGAQTAALQTAFGRTAVIRTVTISDRDGRMLASLPLEGNTFAVSYRNSLYGTPAEERYRVLPDGRFRQVEIAADQLAVLEEYYAVPGAPRRAPGTDRRAWIVDTDPLRPAVFGRLSLAATDLGRRTLHVSGSPPLELWRLTNDENPFIVLDLKENP